MLSMKRTTASVVTSMFYPNVQNGVVDNKGFFFASSSGAADTSPGPMASFKQKAEDELDGCPGEVDGCYNKVVRSGRNGTVKGLKLDNNVVSRFPPSTNEDGSLPTSPDSPSNMPEFPSGQSELERETRELIGTLYRIYIGSSGSGRSRHNALTTLRRVIDDLIVKHQITFNGMVHKLNLEQQSNDMSFIHTVATNIFNDGTTNWGRIASLMAFGAVVCQRLKEADREDCVGAVGEQISTYLVSDQHDWLINNKGWDGFVDFFHVEDPESAVRNALMTIAGVAGFGAGLALLMR